MRFLNKSPALPHEIFKYEKFLTLMSMLSPVPAFKLWGFLNKLTLTPIYEKLAIFVREWHVQKLSATKGYIKKDSSNYVNIDYEIIYEIYRVCINSHHFKNVLKLQLIPYFIPAYSIVFSVY